MAGRLKFTREKRMNRERTKLYTLIASTLVVLAALAYTIFLHYGGHSTGADNAIDDSAPLGLQSGSGPPKEQRSSVIEMDIPPTPINGDGETTSGELVERPYSTNLLFIDEAGKPAANVAFEVVLTSTGVDRYGYQMTEARYGVSDSEGTAKLVSRTNSFHGVVKVGDQDWVKTADIEFAGATYALPTADGGENSNSPLIVPVQSLVPIEFRIVYDDGQPFSGTASVESKKFPWLAAGTNVDDTSKCILRVPIIADMECWVKPSRPGYARIRHPIPLEQLYAGSLIEIVVPASSRPIGDLFVDTSPLTRGRARWWYQLIMRDTGKSVSSATGTSVQVGDSREWNNLKPGWYVLIAGCGDKVSRAEFEVKHAELAKVVLDQIFDPAEVSVIIQDEAGNALNGGVLRAPTRRYVDYPARDVPGTVGVSDSSGVARLGYLHPDTTSLIVEASGYEPKTVNVSLSSGQITDLGPVRLDAAVGRINVRVESMKEGQAYTLGCIDPYGSGGTSNSVELSGADNHTYNRMPMRMYTVYVVLKEGGTVHSINVELTPETPVVSVVLDASKTAPKK